tara:strand:+ start:435 stop:800 length:366 start_codon:yes stop_codon:yes gene_type:complete
MKKTEIFAESIIKAHEVLATSLNNIHEDELRYLRVCVRDDRFDIECFEDLEESGLVEVGVGVDCEEFTIQVHVSVELIEETDTNFSQINITDILIDGVLNFEGEYIEIDNKTEEAIIKKLK